MKVKCDSAHASLFMLRFFNPVDDEQVQKPRMLPWCMGWWPFGKKSDKRTSNSNDPILKDTRTWLSELRDACELHFDKPEEARRQIRHMQVEWKEALDNDVLPATTREGLESRAFRLLTCTDKEWLAWLDNLDFWKAGWKPENHETNEP